MSMSVNLGEGGLDNVILGCGGIVSLAKGEDGQLFERVLDMDGELGQMALACDSDLSLTLEALSDRGWKGHVVLECMLKGEERMEDDDSLQGSLSPPRTLSPVNSVSSNEGSALGSGRASPHGSIRSQLKVTMELRRR